MSSPKNATRAAEVSVLFGALRSGTTMLRLMIDGHPRLLCPRETDFLTDHLIPAPGGGWKYDLKALAADRIFKDSGIPLPDTSNCGPAFRSMLEALRGGQSGHLVLVLHRHLERLLDLIPETPVVHLVRDPRDVARSAVGMGWAGHVYYGADTWLKAEDEWERVTSRLVKNQILELRYESVVRDPETMLGDVCSFLGERYDPKMLSYPEHSTYDYPDPSLTEQWRTRLDEDTLRLLEPRFGDLLVRRGYALSGYPPIFPGRAERFSLWFRNKRAVLRFRVTRFGLRDTLVTALAKRVGLEQLAASARARMQDVTRKHLK